MRALRRTLDILAFSLMAVAGAWAGVPERDEVLMLLKQES